MDIRLKSFLSFKSVRILFTSTSIHNIIFEHTYHLIKNQLCCLTIVDQQVTIMSIGYEKLCVTRILILNGNSIFIDIPPPPQIPANIPDCIHIKQPNKTNTVPFMAKPSRLLKTIFMNELNYPLGASIFLMDIMVLMMKPS